MRIYRPSNGTASCALIDTNSGAKVASLTEVWYHMGKEKTVPNLHGTYKLVCKADDDAEGGGKISND
ncbi:hypothetical protein GCM10010124_41340 [Pilimelia terevasa]|uniref:Uncharacterized protein n=1 Tax=Pilimelia terevasa TaxID=53372 RepID=A0A8J3BRA6_9ACTN|nr:hypothetical protein GCM10010124_41340 [Pilimelia terevasa]